jgi:hypothetical protein
MNYISSLLLFYFYFFLFCLLKLMKVVFLLLLVGFNFLAQFLPYFLLLLFIPFFYSFFFFNGKSISSPFALWVKFSSNCCCRPLSVLSQCSFSFVQSSSHFLLAQELITLVGRFFMVVQGYVAALFSSSFFFFSLYI